MEGRAQELWWDSTEDHSLHVLHHHKQRVAVVGLSVRSSHYMLNLKEWSWALLEDLCLSGEEDTLPLAMERASEMYLRFVKEQCSWLPENVIYYKNPQEE
jgi:hypothetical protein